MCYASRGSTACMLTIVPMQTPLYSLTCSVEGQEMMVWKGLDACSNEVAAQAQLNWNRGGKQLPLQGGVQTAHVTQPVWLKLQHLLCFCWCIHLQNSPVCNGARDCLLSQDSRSLDRTSYGRAWQGRAGQGWAGQGNVCCLPCPAQPCPAIQHTLHVKLLCPSVKL